MAASKPILYSAWISSCSFRVRIALNLKGNDQFEDFSEEPTVGEGFEQQPSWEEGNDQFEDFSEEPTVGEGFEQQPSWEEGLDYEYRAVTWADPDYEKINPIKYVPAFVDGDFVVSDSLAIIFYLEDKYPQHPLLPQDLKKKAINLQIANIVCSSIQPLQCYAVVGLLDGKLGSDESLHIVQHYIHKGFRAIEKLLEGCDSKYATGDEIQLADVFLAPQIHAGVTRFQIDMSKYPLLERFYKADMETPAVQVAIPEKQPDAPSPGI